MPKNKKILKEMNSVNLSLTPGQIEGLNKINSLLYDLTKVIGEGELNEITLYDDMQVEQKASEAAQKFKIAEKSKVSIKKFM